MFYIGNELFGLDDDIKCRLARKEVILQSLKSNISYDVLPMWIIYYFDRVNATNTNECTSRQYV